MELLDTRAGLGVVATAILLFGFAPGVVLRVVILAWPREHPRRKELRGELAMIEYWKRPLWVAEQIETALFDGFGSRLDQRRAHVVRAPLYVNGVLGATGRAIGQLAPMHLSGVTVSIFLSHRLARPPFRRHREVATVDLGFVDHDQGLLRPSHIDAARLPLRSESWHGVPDRGWTPPEWDGAFMRLHVPIHGRRDRYLGRILVDISCPPVILDVPDALAIIGAAREAGIAVGVPLRSRSVRKSLRGAH